MAAPVLSTYQYQYKDDGFLLNGDVALPFIDVTKVQGLDMPDVDADIKEYDSWHGGYVAARFVNVRTIIITGILYADVNQVDVVTDLLKTNFMPSDEEYPFYFKGAGIGQRYIMCKSLGVKYDIDRLRSIGSCPIQFQLGAGDVVQYVDNPDVVVTSGNTGVLQNAGNTPTYPAFELLGIASAISLIKEATGETVTWSQVTDADDLVEIDFNTRSAMINGQKKSTSLTSLGWWAMDPGNTTVRVISKGTNVMVNGNCEANFGAGFAVGTNWNATQQATDAKHTGTKGLKLVRRNKTNANGHVTIPTGTTGATGTWTVSLWLKGTMKKINISLLSGATVVKTVPVAVSPTTWQQFSIVHNFGSASGALSIKLDDLNAGSKLLLKDKKLYVDDIGLQEKSTDNVTATIITRDGWL